MSYLLTRTEQRFICKLIFDCDLWDKIILYRKETEDGYKDYLYDKETDESISVKDGIVYLYELMRPYEYYETPYTEIYMIENLMTKYGHNIQNYTYGLSDAKYTEELNKCNGIVWAVVQMLGSHKCAGSKTIGARDWAANICDQVEDLLEEYDIQIPDENRNGDEGEACLYGHAFDVLMSRVEEILTELVWDVRDHPNCEYDFSRYAG